MNLEKIGKFLAQLRKEQNITQEELADKIGVSAKTVSKWERGKNFPDTIWLCKLSEIFNVGVEDIVNGERIDITKKERKVPAYFIKLNKKKSKKKIIFLLMIILVIFACLFSVIYTITNFNRNKIFAIISKDKSYSVSGYIIYNQNEELFILENIAINDTSIGTNLEPIIKKYNVTIKNDKETYYSYEVNIDNNYNVKLSEALKISKVSFNESNDKNNIINSDNIKNLYIVLSYVDINDNVTEEIIKLKAIEDYANNKLFY